MARIEFNEQGAELHGTFAGMKYRYTNGKQHARLQMPDPLPKKPTAADKERFRKQQVVMWAVSRIQVMLYEQGKDKSIRRMQELADQYDTYMHHAKRKYEEWRERFEDDRRFARAIAYWYVTGKVSPEIPELAVGSRESHPMRAKLCGDPEHRTPNIPPMMDRYSSDNGPMFLR